MVAVRSLPQIGPEEGEDVGEKPLRADRPQQAGSDVSDVQRNSSPVECPADNSVDIINKVSEGWQEESQKAKSCQPSEERLGKRNGHCRTHQQMFHAEESFWADSRH